MKSHNNNQLLLTIIASLFCLSGGLSGWGQFAIPWYKISGGGGTSTNGSFTLSGTIGQADAGAQMNGGNFALTPGYWSFLGVLQTPGAPALNISHAGNTVTVFWQNVPGWNLQQNNNLATPAGWSVNSNWTTSNGTNYLNLTSPAGNLFFRLISTP